MKYLKSILLLSLFALASCGATGEANTNSEDLSSEDSYSQPTYTDYEFTSTKVSLMPEVMAGSSQKGSVESFRYDTYKYNTAAFYPGSELEPIEKLAFVYLPYGYTPSKQYNVLVLLHGSGDSEGFWLAQDDRGNRYSVDDQKYFPYEQGNYTLNVLDYMYEHEMAKDTIIVTPSFYENADVETGLAHSFENRVVPDNWGAELIEAVLPTVIERYSTFASSSSEEDMIAARDHFAYAGLSMGGMTCIRSIMKRYLQYFGSYGIFSAGANDMLMDQTIEALESEAYAPYAINELFMACGTDDVIFIDNERANYQYFKDHCSKFDDHNIHYVDINDTGHTYEAWISCLYNGLPTFFK